MIEIFRNWIVALLCLSVLIVIIKLIIPKTKLRKYIYTLIGIITVITILSPVVDLLKSKNVEESISDVLFSIENNGKVISVNSNGLEDRRDELVKMQFIDNLKSDVMFKLADKKIVVNNVNVSIDEEFNIKKININIAKIDQSKTSVNSISEIIKYLNAEYDIDSSKITVIEEGE